MTVERETRLWKSERRLFKLGERGEEQNDETLLFLCDICPLNGISSTERSNQTVMRSQRERARETGRKTQERRQENEKEWKGRE